MSKSVIFAQFVEKRPDLAQNVADHLMPLLKTKDVVYFSGVVGFSVYNELKKSRCLEEIAIVLLCSPEVAQCRLNGIVFYAALGDHPSLGLTSHGKHVKRVNSHLRCAKYVAEIVFVRPGLISMSWPKQFLNAWKKMTSSTLRLPLLSRRCLVSQSNNGGQRSCECCDNWQWTLSMLRVSCD